MSAGPAARPSTPTASSSAAARLAGTPAVGTPATDPGARGPAAARHDPEHGPGSSSDRRRGSGSGRGPGPGLGRLPGSARLVIGLAALALGVGYLATAVDLGVLASAGRALLADPVGLGAVLVLYAAAMLARAVSWRRVLPGLSLGQAWAALHVALLGNHVLPLRLGEALRVTSVLRRTPLSAGPVVASAVTLRAADLLAVLALAALLAPALLGGWLLAASAVLAVVGLAGLLALLLLRRRGAGLRLPGPLVAVVALGAWLLESAVVWQTARAAGVSLSVAEAVAVTAATIAAQAVAVTPGGVGSYEAAGAAALAGLGVPPGSAVATVVLAHAVKTAYSFAVGAVALVRPAPSYHRLPRLRLPRVLPTRTTAPPGPGPVLLFFPAYDEEASVEAVVARTPAQVCGRPVHVLVVDDGSRDATAAVAAAAGASLVSLERNRGLGAAVRCGLAEGVARGAAVVVFADADAEYAPEELARLVGPVLAGEADYVVGSRFAGSIASMRPHRRLGNRVLTRLLSWVARRRITDGQSGYRALSAAAAAAAEIAHDYNYAQVLTLDLVRRGFRYAEVPISYRFRTTGSSFVRLPTYLRRVTPAVLRVVNAEPEPPAPERTVPTS